MPNAKLQPVATPVDPFISAPGISGPVQTQFDFQALRGLSQSLDSALNTAAEIERKRIERETIPANESLLEKLTKDQVLVLDTADPETSAGLKQLQSLGVKDADNGYAIAQLRKAAGVYQVQSAGYANFMRDTQWQTQAAQQVLYNHANAQDVVKARADEFIKSLPPMTSEYAKVAAANYMAAENLKVIEEIGVAKDKVFQEDTARSALTALQPVVDSVVQQWAGNDNPEYRAIVSRTYKAYLEQQTKILGSPERAEVLVTQAIETSALQLARDEGEAAQHLMDYLEESIGTPTMLPKLEDIRNKVDREIRSSRERGDESKARSSATFALNKALSQNPVRGSEQLREWIFMGEGRQILEQAAKANGVPIDQLADVQEGVYRFWAGQQEGSKSDQNVVQAIQKMARRGHVDEAEAFLNTMGLDKVTTQDRPALYALIDREKQRGSNSPEARQEMQAGFEAQVGDQGKLYPEAATAVNSGRLVYNQAYKKHLDENPDDFTGADIAGTQAFQASPQFKQLETLREQSTIQFFKSSQGYRDTYQLVNEIKAADKAQVVKSAATPEDVDLTGHALTWMKIEANVDRSVDGLFQKLSADPEVQKLPAAERNYLISSKIKQAMPDFIEAARGNLPAQVPDKQVLAVTTDTQLQTFENLGDLANFHSEKDKIVQESFAGTSGDAFSLAVGMDDGNVDWFASGDLRGYAQAQAYPLAKDALELALSARIVDGFQPANEAQAGRNAAGIIAQRIQSTQSAKSLLKLRLITRGLMPEEIIAGRTKAGVPLGEVFSDGKKPWYSGFPLQQVAIYHSPAELDKEVQAMEENPEKSKLAQVLRALRIDPEESKAVNKFVEWQTKLANLRSSAEADGAESRQTSLRDLAHRSVTIDQKDPPWLKKRKQEWINFMEKSNAK